MAKKKAVKKAPTPLLRDTPDDLAYPESRTERFLNAIRTADPPSAPTDPETRLERYLAAIAAGDKDLKPANPETRIERYLDAIVENGGGGGGGHGMNLIIEPESPVLEIL